MELSYLSLSFAAFLLCLLVTYVMTPNRHKWRTLLLFSLIFYASNGLDKLVFMLGTSAVVYMVSRKLEGLWESFDAQCLEKELASTEKKELQREYKRRGKRVLCLSLVICIGILCWCKYAAKLFRLINRLTGSSWTVSIIIPLGISYYTFSSIGYLLDIYWRKNKQPEHNYLKLLLCMIYFPHVVSGPISRYDRLLPQFDKLARPTYERFCMGMQLTLWGLFQKMVIADRLSIFVDKVFTNYAVNEGLIFVVAMILGAFRAYADFSGCMDIVCGISEVLGVELDQNFNHPFFSKSAAEFWRRWHITLGTWFKDYVYVPVSTSSLARNIRRGVSKRFGSGAGKAVMTILPLSAVWLLTGLWHGTGFNYVLWGAYWGILICCSTLLEGQYKKISQKLKINPDDKLWECFQMLRTFVLYCAGLLLVLAGSTRRAFGTLQRMFSTFNPWIFWDQSLYNYGLDRRNFMLAVVSIVILLFVHSLQEKTHIRRTIASSNIVLRWCVYFLGIFSVIIFGVYGLGYNAQDFIYRQF